MDKQTYTIGGSEYTQDFLTIDEMERFFSLVKGLELKGKQALDIVKELRENNVLLDLLNLVLKGPAKLKSHNQVKPVTLLKIVRDFFYLNDLLDGVSTSFEAIMEIVNDEQVMKVIASVPMISQTMKQFKNLNGTDSSPQPPMETSGSTTMSEKEST